MLGEKGDNLQTRTQKPSPSSLGEGFRVRVFEDSGLEPPDVIG
jgi:hypothetical protein